VAAIVVIAPDLVVSGSQHCQTKASGVFGRFRSGAIPAQFRREEEQHRIARDKFPHGFLTSRFSSRFSEGPPPARRAFFTVPDLGPAIAKEHRSIGKGKMPQESTAICRIQPDSLNTVCYVLTRRQCLSYGHYHFSSAPWSNSNEEATLV
jgi:hypothetical protein